MIYRLFFFLLIAAAVHAAAVDVNCANAADDAKKLNAAIVASKSGDEIRIHGACLANETIILYGNRTYLGDSRTGTVIRQADGANLPALVASDSWANNTPGTGSPVRVAHLTIDGNRARNTGTNALVIRSWLTVLEDLQVRSAPGDGIQLTNLPRDGKTRLTSTQVNGRISNCFVTGSGRDGIHVLDPGNSVTDWDLLDSWIASSGRSAINLENAAGWKIVGNHAYGIGEHAIWAHRCFGTTIADNYIEGFGDAGGEGKTFYGIACTVQGGAASVIRDNKVLRLSAKPATANLVHLGVPRVNSGTGVLNVTGNVIRGRGGERETGLSYQVGEAASGLQIVSGNNNVQQVGTPRAVGPKVKLVDPL